MRRALYARRLLTPAESIENAAILLQDGVIAAVGTRAEVIVPASTPSDDYGDAVLAPGLIDIHVHGGGGVDTMSADRGALDGLRQHLARHGVTAFLATTVSAAWPDLLAAVTRLGQAGADIHLEGPFISPLRRGVHPEEVLLLPTIERLHQLWERSQAHIRLITLAPELDGALDFIAAAVKLGIRIALGHSNATMAQAEAAIEAGACHVTHTFNAMRPLHQREPGLLGLALADPGLSAEIIADGVHVDPVLVRLFLRAKAPGRAILVSDGISAAGMGDGQFHLGNIAVTVSGSRCCCGDTLAGSVLTLDRALCNVRLWSAWGWADTVSLACQNPATLMGWERKGRLAPGGDADIAVFSPCGEIVAVYVAGKLVH
ncbi:MAG: N-acetylglucosamine-6-phosphate deacetylase [Terriglobales bacterium]